MKEIGQVLDELWGTTIETFNIDMLKHTIELLVKSIDNDIETTYDIILSGVVSFNWIDCWEHTDPADIEDWNYIDLTSIGICKNVKVYIKGEYWASKYSATPNIGIEIWNSALFIDAAKLTVNGQEYILRK